jgi:hypothetical protein
MKIKPQPPRSCLGWLGWVFASLLLIFVLGNVYAQWRMAQATQDLASLARELGYTPDAHLHHRIAVRDVSIITGSAYCEAKLYYTTSMSAAKFTAQLNQMLPETKGIGWMEESNTTLYTLLNLTVDGMETWGGQNFSRQEPMKLYYWPLSESDTGPIRLYETMELKTTVEYKGTQIRGNTIKLYANGGVFPVWMNCPATLSDAPARLSIRSIHVAS